MDQKIVENQRFLGKTHLCVDIVTSERSALLSSIALPHACDIEYGRWIGRSQAIFRGASATAKVHEKATRVLGSAALDGNSGYRGGGHFFLTKWNSGEILVSFLLASVLSLTFRLPYREVCFVSQDALLVEYLTQWKYRRQMTESPFSYLSNVHPLISHIFFSYSYYMKLSTGSIFLFLYFAVDFPNRTSLVFSSDEQIILCRNVSRLHEYFLDIFLFRET